MDHWRHLAATRRRILALPPPATGAPGTLEHAVGVILHRIAPFDAEVHNDLARSWELFGPVTTPCPDRRRIGQRTLGVLLRLRRLSAAVPPPPSLAAGVALLGSAPWLSEAGAALALRLAGVTAADAGLVAVRELASIWSVPGAAALRPHHDHQADLHDLARTVRAAGPVQHAEPIRAADAAWLRQQHGVHVFGGHLVLGDDRRSPVARPLRRQLAAVGPLDPATLADGARRERPELASLTATAVRLWAAAQPDIGSRNDGLLELHGPVRPWLRGSDGPVRQLFLHTPRVRRSLILATLVDNGHREGSAETWLARCAWLRTTHQRGTYGLAGQV